MGSLQFFFIPRRCVPNFSGAEARIEAEHTPNKLDDEPAARNSYLPTLLHDLYFFCFCTFFFLLFGCYAQFTSMKAHK